MNSNIPTLKPSAALFKSIKALKKTSKIIDKSATSSKNTDSSIHQGVEVSNFQLPSSASSTRHQESSVMEEGPAYPFYPSSSSSSHLQILTQDSCVSDLESFDVAEPKQKKAQIFKVQISNNSFSPTLIRIPQGSFVEWSLAGTEESSDYYTTSLYGQKTRMHVVSFDELGEESGPLKTDQDKWRLKFSTPGIYDYKCSIYTRMRGQIIVIGKRQPKPQAVFRPIKGDLSFIMDKQKKESSSKQEPCLETVIEAGAIDFPTADKSNPKSQSKQPQFDFEPEEPEPQGSIKATSDEESEQGPAVLKRGVSPEHQSPPVKKEDDGLSSRLIEVLEKEDDLRKAVQADTDTPVIKSNYFQEIFETNRGNLLRVQRAELQMPDEESESDMKFANSQSDTDEEEYMNQQRKTTKIISQINQGELNQDKYANLEPLQSLSHRSKSFIGSTSNCSSSIDELKAKGYFELPEGKPKRRLSKTDFCSTPIEQAREEQVKLSLTEMCRDEEETTSEEKFWRKPEEAQPENESPNIYDKFTYVKYSEFSRMFHPVPNSELKPDNLSQVSDRPVRVDPSKSVDANYFKPVSKFEIPTSELSQSEQSIAAARTVQPPQPDQRPEETPSEAMSSRMTEDSMPHNRPDNGDSEDEEAALARQRKNQKKRQRKKAKKKATAETSSQMTSNATESLLSIQSQQLPEEWDCEFDRQLVKQVPPDLERSVEVPNRLFPKFVQAQVQKLSFENVQDEYVVVLADLFLSDRFNESIKGCEAW